MEDSLKKRYSIKLFANILSGLIGAILIAIVPKALGPIAYGQFIYLQDFFIKIIGFLDMGSSIAFFTKLSANQKRKELISFYFIYSFSVLLIVTLFIYFMDKMGYVSNLLPQIPNEYIYLGLFFGFFTWLTQIFIKISDAYALTVSVELIKITHKILSLFLLFYFIYESSFDLTSYFYFHYISLFSFFSILIWLFIKKDIFKNTSFKTQDLQLKKITKEFFDYCHPLFVYSVLAIIVGLFDIWILQKVAGSEETGFYGLAYSLATMCFLFTGAMTPIITREFAKSYGEQDLEKMKKLFYRYIPMLYTIATYFSVFIVVQSETVLAIFTDEKFKDAYLVLMVMAFYPIHQTYGQLSGSIFYATGQTKLLRNISLFTQPLGLLLSFLFIYILDLGAIGLAWKMIIIQFIGVNIQLYFNAKFLEFDIKYFIFHQFYVVIVFFCIALVSSYFVISTSPIINFLLSGFIYTILVIILTFLFPQIVALTRNEVHEVLTRLKNVIKRKIKK
jgi:O-antigen/teichoic acid export membrane protein